MKIIKYSLIILFLCLYTFTGETAYWMDDFSGTNYIQSCLNTVNNSYQNQFMLAAEQNMNLAYQKTVQSSSVQDNDPQYNPENAVDGDMVSRYSSVHADNQWFLIQYDNPVFFNKIAIYWESAYAQAFRVMISMDNVSYEEVSYTHNFIQKNNGKTNISSISLNERKRAKYIKIMLDTRATIYGFSFYELEVYNIITLDDGVVDASSSETGHQPNYAFDLDLSTRWSSGGEDDEYLSITFNKDRYITVAYLMWEAYGTKFQFDLSTDGESWETVYSNHSFGGGNVYAYSNYPIKTKKARMYGIEHGSRNQDDTPHGSEWGNFSLFEMMICLAQFQYSGNIISKPIVPAGLQAWQKIYYKVDIPVGTSITVYVFDQNADINNNNEALIVDLADQTLNTIDISSLDTATYQGLILKAVLYTSSGDVTPAIDQWSVHYGTSSDYLKVNDFQLQSQSFNVTQDMSDYNFLLTFGWSISSISSVSQYRVYRDTEPITENSIFLKGLTPHETISKSKSLCADIVESEKNYYYSLAVVDTNGYHRLSNNTISLLIDLDYNPVWVWVPSNWIWVEGENFLEKDSGGLDAKSAASGGYCLGNNFNGWAVYDATIRKSMSTAFLYLRYATLNNPDLNIYLDDFDTAVDTPKLAATTDWNGFEYSVVYLGLVEAGTHKLKIDPSDNINFDGFYLYDGYFDPDNTVNNGVLDPPPLWRRLSILIEKNITLSSTQLQDARINPFIKNPNPVVSYKYSIENNKDAYLNDPVIIRLYFNQSDVPAGVNINDLSIFYWDDRHWNKVGGKLNFIDGNYYLSTKVNHFSTFAVFEGSGYTFDEPVKWSYNPFSPNNDGICDSSQMTFKLFKNGKVVIKIFNLKGKLIRKLVDNELTADDYVSIEWNGRNEENRAVPTGIYIYQIETDCLVPDKKVVNGTIIVTR